MAEGKDNLKMMEGGKWKWDKSPGDGRTQSCFRCNARVSSGLTTEIGHPLSTPRS